MTPFGANLGGSSLSTYPSFSNSCNEKRVRFLRYRVQGLNLELLFSVVVGASGREKSSFLGQEQSTGRLSLAGVLPLPGEGQVYSGRAGAYQLGCDLNPFAVT